MVHGTAVERSEQMHGTVAERSQSLHLAPYSSLFEGKIASGKWLVENTFVTLLQNANETVYDKLTEIKDQEGARSRVEKGKRA